jgi:branched-subunit amino acid transport protein
VRIRLPALPARAWRHLHAAAVAVWAALTVPTVLWWHDSVLWVGLMSCYANLVGHFSAYQAARAEGSKLWSRLHIGATGAWAALTVPTVLWWHDSVLWVALMSVYAIAVGHVSAWQGSRAEESNGG